MDPNTEEEGCQRRAAMCGAECKDFFLAWLPKVQVVTLLEYLSGYQFLVIFKLAG